jgi:hypothetical protein
MFFHYAIDWSSWKTLLFSLPALLCFVITGRNAFKHGRYIFIRRIKNTVKFLHLSFEWIACYIELKLLDIETYYTAYISRPFSGLRNRTINDFLDDNEVRFGFTRWNPFTLHPLETSQFFFLSGNVFWWRSITHFSTPHSHRYSIFVWPILYLVGSSKASPSTFVLYFGSYLQWYHKISGWFHESMDWWYDDFVTQSIINYWWYCTGLSRWHSDWFRDTFHMKHFESFWLVGWHRYCTQRDGPVVL